MPTSSNSRRRGYGRPSLDQGPVITLEQIVAVGLSIAEKEGFSAIGMRRVASALGVWPNTLYHYVPNKQAFLELVADAAMSAYPRPRMSVHPTWDERLRVGTKAWWRALKRYRGLAEFWSAGFWTGQLNEKAIPDLQEMTASLLDAGLDEAAARDLMIIVASLVYGLMRPYLHRSENVGDVNQPERDSEHLLEEGLELIIEGVRSCTRGAVKTAPKHGVKRIGQA